MNRLTEDEKLFIAEHSSWSLMRLCKELKKGKSTVWFWLKHYRSPKPHPIILEKDTLISLINEGLSERSISEKMNVSLYIVKRNLFSHGLQTITKNRNRKPDDAHAENKKCTLCGKEYIYSRSHRNTSTRCHSCAVNYRRHKLQEKMYNYLGGARCVVCGYEKCVKALHFHHINPDEKIFSISGAHSRSWQSIQEELDKCVVLCANCHAEIHAGVIDLPIIKGS